MVLKKSITRKNLEIMATIGLKKIVSDMLKENTGKHFLDSGFENGRMWQQNQDIDFENTPRIEVEFFNDNYDYITVSTYHYLCEVLNEDDEISENVNHYIWNKDNGVHWVQDVEDFIDEMGYEWANSEVINTYNYENNLSQVLLFREFIVDGQRYALLQIHGGADVRGGYTQVRCFPLKGYLTGLVDVFGTVNGEQVSNLDCGYKLLYDDGDNHGEEVNFTKSDNFDFDFNINEY